MKSQAKAGNLLFYRSRSSGYETLLQDTSKR